MRFLALIVLLPLIEVAMFAQVGGKIGAMGAVFLTLCTAFVGVFLIKTQGFRTLTQVREQVAQGQMPAEAMLSGVLVFVSGAFLLIPGFVTDTLGLILLLPFVRKSIAGAILSKGIMMQAGQAPSQPQGKGQVIEGQYHKED
ncbi:membrane protein FxsA [Oceaniserpentilla sp. 4NH20-0058]|uniref:FxsA family protein n=1 Tax=Oceaniserpentilla sp. 4NH20-0058 TaxID=3127660 RepID=UPI003108D2CA